MAEDSTHTTATIVIPCYNEERRLDVGAFVELSTTPGLSLLFVDDGSSDRTPEILAGLASASDSIEVLVLTRNVGKGNAIREGVRRVMEGETAIVGYLDADLATPASELLRLLRVLESDPSLSVVMGSRVKRLGSHIERSTLRHMVGRVYATVAAFALGVSVYDTQCGAKVMRVSPALRVGFEKPFGSSWSFDAWLLARLMRGSDAVRGLAVEEFCEVSLLEWREVSGSKLRLRHALRAFGDLALLALRRVRARRRAR